MTPLVLQYECVGSSYDEGRVRFDGNVLYWTTSYDDMGRSISSDVSQTLESFLSRGPACQTWPFFKCDVPFEVLEALCRAAEIECPPWIRRLTDRQLSVFEAPSASAVIRLSMEGAPLDEPDHFGFHPVWYAVKSEREEVAVALLERGADSRRLYAGVPDYATLLHGAVYLGRPELVEALLGRFQADPNQPNERGETPIFFVEISHRTNRHTLRMTEALLAAGADPNYRAINGDTPLRRAGHLSKARTAIGRAGGIV